MLAVVWILAGDKIAGARVLCKKRESIAQDLALKLAHLWTAKAIADFEPFRIERARRAHLG